MYESESYEVILKRMLARVSEKFDKREGSVIYDAHSPTAIELQLLYIQLDTILREAYGDTASRDYLILRCRERGIEPEPAKCAVVRGSFGPSSIDVTGKRFSCGNFTYTAINSTDLECETPGTEGGKQRGRLIPVDYIDGLETAEIAGVVTPGEEEEDTEDLRRRYLDSFANEAFGGNIKDYIDRTNAVQGVGSTKVTRIWNGSIKPADLIPTEEVTSWYNNTFLSSSAGTAVKSWLKNVYEAGMSDLLTVGGKVLLTILDSEYNAPTDELIASVQETIDPRDHAGEGYGIAPVGHLVTVQGAAAVEINITTQVTFDDMQDHSEEIKGAVSEYLAELRKRWSELDSITVSTAQINAHILSVTGVTGISNTAVNGNPANVDITLGEYEVPVLGGVTIE